MPTMHLFPLSPARYAVVVQQDDQPLSEAQAIALTRGGTSIPSDAVGAMLSHPSFRQQYADCIIHRGVPGSL